MPATTSTECHIFLCTSAPSTHHRLVADEKTNTQEGSPEVTHFVLTSLHKNFFENHFSLLRLHTFWYYKLLFLLLLKRRKWHTIKYQATCFLLTVISSAICNYLFRMFKLGILSYCLTRLLSSGIWRPAAWYILLNSNDCLLEGDTSQEKVVFMVLKIM